VSIQTGLDGSVGWIILDRPEVMNAISVDLAVAWEKALRELGERPDVSVVAIRGAGGNFCAGGDFAEVQHLKAAGPEHLDRLFSAFRRVTEAVREIPAVVVAVVEGNAMAGGFEFVQAADLSIVRDDARLADNHIRFGHIPGGGGSQRLPRLLGRTRALAHLLTGECLTGREAADLGLVSISLPADEFEDGVSQLLRRLTSYDALALTRIKQLVDAGLEGSLERGLDLEQRAVVDHIAHHLL